MSVLSRAAQSPTGEIHNVSDHSAFGKTFEDEYDEFITPSASPIKSEVDTPSTIDSFSRKALDESFGPGFSSIGFKKRGEKTLLPAASSPAVNSGIVKLCEDGKIDLRSAAVQRGLVVVDDDKNIIKSESIFCKQQIFFTSAGNISKSSAAVKSRLLLLDKDGQVDKRCSAAKKGWVVVDKEGTVDTKKSILCKPKQLFLKVTNGAHIVGFELADKITQREYTSFPNTLSPSRVCFHCSTFLFSWWLAIHQRRSLPYGFGDQ